MKFPKSWAASLFIIFLLYLNLFVSYAIGQERLSSPHIAGVLLASDIRLAPFQGLKDGLAELGMQEGKEINFIVKNALGEKNKLLPFAQELIAQKPDIVIAAGGIEADALKVATEKTNTPVVFLSVASAVTRGLVLSLHSSGNNLTGIDTADTQLTGRRLWFISKMFPAAKKVYILHVPSIPPSVDSLAAAKKIAPMLGLELVVETGDSKDELIAKADAFSAAKGDVILLLPVAQVSSVLKQHLFPAAMREKIPIFGYGRVSIKNGASASFAGSRYRNGMQAALLVKKILGGVPPASLPIEQPKKPEFIINKWVTDQLGINLQERVLQLADEIVEEKID